MRNTYSQLLALIMTETEIVHIVGIILLIVAGGEIVHLLVRLRKRFSIIGLIVFVLILTLNFIASYGIWIMSLKTAWPSILPFLLLGVSTIIYLLRIFSKKKQNAK